MKYIGYFILHLFILGGELMKHNFKNLSIINKDYSLQNQFTIALSVIALAVYTVALCRYNSGEFFQYPYWKSIQIIPFIVLVLCSVLSNYVNNPKIFLSVSQFSNVIMMLLNLMFFYQMTYTNAYYETIRLLFRDNRYIKLSLIITFVFGVFALLSAICGNSFWCKLYYSMNTMFYLLMFIYMFFDEYITESDIFMSAAYLLYYNSHLVFTYILDNKNYRS